MNTRENAMRLVKLVIGAALAMALVAAGFAHAGVEKAGTTAANFLSVGSGAAILGMGGATIGLGDDLAASAWNPAALGWAANTEMVLSHAGLANGSLQDWAAAGGRIGQSSTHWAVSGLYHGDGSFEGRDASNNPTGSFGVSSMAFGGAIAQNIADHLTIGVGTKFVTEKLGDVVGSGVTFDAGLNLHAGVVGLGLAAQNVGGQMKYQDGAYPFPANYGAGAAVVLPASGLRVALDANFPDAYYPDVRGGVEWRWRGMLALRGGYRKEMSSLPDALSGPTFGLGAGKNGWWFDYGYLLSSSGEGQHRIGVRLVPGSWGMGEFGAKAADEPEQTKPERRARRDDGEAGAPAMKEPKPSKKAARSAAEKDADSQSADAPVPAAASSAPPATAKPASAPAAAPVSAAPAAPAPAKQPSAPAPTPEARPTKVVVKSGDTLASIGRRYGISVPTLMMENNLVSDQISVGQVLKLPAP